MRAAICRPSDLKKQAVLMLHCFALQHDCLMTELVYALDQLRNDPKLGGSEEHTSLVRALLTVSNDIRSLEEITDRLLAVDCDFAKAGETATAATVDELRERRESSLQSTRDRLEQLLSHPRTDCNENP